MKEVLDWIWFGPWWTPIVGALYFSAIISILFGPIKVAWKGKKYD